MNTSQTTNLNAPVDATAAGSVKSVTDTTAKQTVTAPVRPAATARTKTETKKPQVGPEASSSSSQSSQPSSDSSSDSEDGGAPLWGWSDDEVGDERVMIQPRRVRQLLQQQVQQQPRAQTQTRTGGGGGGGRPNRYGVLTLKGFMASSTGPYDTDFLEEGEAAALGLGDEDDGEVDDKYDENEDSLWERADDSNDWDDSDLIMALADIMW